MLRFSFSVILKFLLNFCHYHSRIKWFPTSNSVLLWWFNSMRNGCFWFISGVGAPIIWLETWRHISNYDILSFPWQTSNCWVLLVTCFSFCLICCFSSHVSHFSPINCKYGLWWGKTKICRGKPANQSIMVVRFRATFSGLQKAEKLHNMYAENQHGRTEFQ